MEIVRPSTVYSSIARVAKFYDFFAWVIGYKRSVNYFVDQLPFEENAKFNVLDAGCGTGIYTIAILKKYPRAQITALILIKG
ncbi:MAG TPA: hypothetical protein VE973_03820 [Candidatus Limnocylindria bacterium]|nr:hypothetical protein [Candidatus Limnocylindria bacterium]